MTNSDREQMPEKVIETIMELLNEERMALEIDENEQHQTEPVNDAPVERSEEESNASDDELRRAA